MEPADRQGAAIETTPRKNIRIPTHLAVSVNNVQFDSEKSSLPQACPKRRIHPHAQTIPAIIIGERADQDKGPHHRH
jgi:hypothetical protein